MPKISSFIMYKNTRPVATFGPDWLAKWGQTRWPNGGVAIALHNIHSPLGRTPGSPVRGRRHLEALGRGSIKWQGPRTDARESAQQAAAACEHVKSLTFARGARSCGFSKTRGGDFSRYRRSWGTAFDAFCSPSHRAPTSSNDFLKFAAGRGRLSGVRRNPLCNIM